MGTGMVGREGAVATAVVLDLVLGRHVDARADGSGWIASIGKMLRPGA